MEFGPLRPPTTIPPLRIAAGRIIPPPPTIPIPFPPFPPSRVPPPGRTARKIHTTLDNIFCRTPPGIERIDPLHSRKGSTTFSHLHLMMNPPGGDEDSEAASLYPIKHILSAIPTNHLLMLIITHSSKYNLDAPTKTARFTFHSDTITTLEHDHEVAHKVALPPTTTQLDGDFINNLQVGTPPHSLPYTHSLDFITTTHKLERLRAWQLFYNNSHVLHLVRTTLPNVSLKLHPFWQMLHLTWKHQDNPDHEIGMAWEEEERHLSKLAGDHATTTQAAHVILDQGYFGSFRQRFNLDGETLCPTCQVIETTNHIILDCPRFEAARHHIIQIKTQFNQLI
ncbi:hypothetical protein H0H81_012140 [Sphagnurus paluster]|uniref:Uncharacterized protein n=1 Tax=Sphagnurus paluster TaxID=117069 RepID=A0A9P7GI63_9AGAR|nr:hypothetical protein H0H81_012140 [Sphagnurus paluster]